MGTEGQAGSPGGHLTLFFSHDLVKPKVTWDFSTYFLVTAQYPAVPCRLLAPPRFLTVPVKTCRCREPRGSL